MAEYVVIRLRGADQPKEWVLVDSNGARHSRVSTGSLEQAAVEAAERPVIALVPAAEVLTTTALIPAKSSAKVRAALPFALEENIADDIDEMHFASGSRQQDDRLPVAVTSKQNMSDWLRQLQDAGIEPVRMVSEAYGLPSIPGSMSVLVDDDCTLFNDGANLNFAMQDVKPSDMLVASGHLGDDVDEEDSPRHLVAFCTSDKEQALHHDWIALRHELSSVDVNVLADGTLPKLAATVASGQGVNLLQGEFGRNPEYTAMLRPWKTAAALLAGLLILGVGAKGLDYWQLSREHDALQSQFAAQYSEIRPGDAGPVADPRSVVASLRQSLGGSSAAPVFLQSLETLSSAIAANSSASIEAITYRAGVVDVRLSAPDVATLDLIQKSVSSSGRFSASIQSADQVGEAIDGRIQIRESGS